MHYQGIVHDGFEVVLKSARLEYAMVKGDSISKRQYLQMMARNVLTNPCERHHAAGCSRTACLLGFLRSKAVISRQVARDVAQKTSRNLSTVSLILGAVQWLVNGLP